MNSVSGADEIGKLFVGGLDWSTTQETLRGYFCQFGEVVDCVIMKDKTTNQSRGFGFVKFKDPNCVGTVLASRPHTLDGRNIDPKPCTPRGMQPERVRPKESWQKGPKVDPTRSNKIFVGGIPHNCGETELRDYFKRFGVVTEVVMIYDAEKQRPRGMWMTTAGQAIIVLGAFGQPAGRGAPPPPAFTSYIVSTPPGGFPPPQAFPQGYGTPPPFTFGYGAAPQPDQFVPSGVPPTPATPGTSIAFPPSHQAQDMNKPPNAQPDFPFTQYAGYGQDMSAFGQGFADPSQQALSYTTGPLAPGGPQAGGSGFGRGQNHNVQGFHPYRR
ncbi:DAZ-associated protein 1 isoform X10 [Pleurodeles waltl]|uniref:DAZ-associated protein 1 isoform X10 n=1 Tax=Pleurodeles waltl TaxID=8319 RepID=UPI0037099DF2